MRFKLEGKVARGSRSIDVKLLNHDQVKDFYRFLDAKFDVPDGMMLGDISTMIIVDTNYLKGDTNWLKITRPLYGDYITLSMEGRFWAHCNTDKEFYFQTTLNKEELKEEIRSYLNADIDKKIKELEALKF